MTFCLKVELLTRCGQVASRGRWWQVSPPLGWSGTCHSPLSPSSRAAAAAAAVNHGPPPPIFVVTSRSVEGIGNISAWRYWFPFLSLSLLKMELHRSNQRGIACLLNWATDRWAVGFWTKLNSSVWGFLFMYMFLNISFSAIYFFFFLISSVTAADWIGSDAAMLLKMFK